MSLDEFRGTAWAFAELMKRAKDDAARGHGLGVTPARKPSQRATARKIHLGLFATKALRWALGWRRESI
jgi:hypothetical protein